MITRHPGGEHLPRHRHAEGYVAVVLAGGYVEAGDGGRWAAHPGTVLVHAAHEAHRDGFGHDATVVLNLPLADGLPPGAGLIDDIDAVARVAERDVRGAAVLVAALWRSGACAMTDWPDLLATALAHDPALVIAEWADAMHLHPASVSRGFLRAYGVTPKRYRREMRARRAVGAIADSRDGLAAIAAAHGFADQSHMTRALTALTGATPGAIRAKSVQSAAATAL